MANLGIGIIGCGNISTTYLRLAPLFKGLEVRAVADMNMAAAKARAAEYGVTAQSVEDLLANTDIDVVINLTIPDAHYAVTQAHPGGRQARLFRKAAGADAGGGHHAARSGGVEGPARRLRARHLPGRRAPAGPRAARRGPDRRRSPPAVAAVQNHGMEHWHPNPDFFFLPGGGPMLDLGPYYVANLINLLGPVKRVWRR